MISAGDFRNGITLEIDGQVVQIGVISSMLSRARAHCAYKLKNVITHKVERHLPSYREVPSGQN